MLDRCIVMEDRRLREGMEIPHNGTRIPGLIRGYLESEHSWGQPEKEQMQEISTHSGLPSIPAFYPSINLWTNSMAATLLLLLLTGSKSHQLKSKNNPLPEWVILTSIPAEMDALQALSGLNSHCIHTQPFSIIIFYMALIIFPFLSLKKLSTRENPN